MNNNYQYQTFDDSPGLVDSFAKLRAMRLPPLVGKSFFDVACNEGYYCGVALRAGASRVVGLDSYSVAIERARARFPKAEFLLQSWDDLPQEHFDVVMFASAMHYIASEEKIIKLLNNLRGCLKADGLLIVEAGISTAPGRELIRVERSDGNVYYPTWEKLVSLIHKAGLVWRKVGLSEPGDNHPRVVMHCRNIKPVVVFVRGQSMSGKSYLSNSLAGYDYSRVLNLDLTLAEVFKSSFPAFRVDESDWPATLNRAVETLTPEEYAGVAGLIAREILERLELAAAAARCPRQDPVVVDGFDKDNKAYQLLFNEVVGKLSALGCRIWDTSLLSSIVQDGRDSERSFADCGGFLLPLGTDAVRGAIIGTELKSNGVEFQAEVKIPDGQRIIGISAVVAGSTPANSIQLPEPVAGGRFSFSISLERLFEGIKNAPDEVKASRLRSVDLHLVYWTDSFQAYWFDRPTGSDKWLFLPGNKKI